MNCSISGELCEDPVVSTKSGIIFERRLIEKHLKEHAKCPITKEDLAVEDLISLQTSKQPVRPRPASATSLASLLKLFQNEWDAVMLETYNLKQHLDSVRQELSHALYQHDAACRVIARLVKQRDEARQALADTQANLAAAVGSAGDVEMKEAEEAGITEAITRKMTSHAKTLSTARKARQKQPPPATLASKEDIESFSVLSSATPHEIARPGILCLDLHPTQPERVVTGGADGAVVVFNRESKKVEHTLKQHKKKVSSVVFHPEKSVILSSSYDNTTVCGRCRKASTPPPTRPPLTRVQSRASRCMLPGSISPPRRWIAAGAFTIWRRAFAGRRSLPPRSRQVSV
eukprot:640130_1